MPFITEEIWQRVAALAGVKGTTIMLQPFPQSDAVLIDANVEREIAFVKSFILGPRRIRSENNIPPSTAFALLVHGGTEEESRWLKHSLTAITSLARLSSVTTTTADTAPESATALAGGMTLMVPLADLIDPGAELMRLDKEIARLQQEQQRVTAKLANENYTSRAPAEVVAKERARLEDTVAAIAQLAGKRKKIARLQ